MNASRESMGVWEYGRAKAAPHSPLPIRPLPVIILFISLLTAAAPARAQQVRAYVSADSTTVGERFRLSLVAEHDTATQALFPDPARGDTLLGDLEVFARLSVTRRNVRAGTRVDSAVYEVATFALDSAFVPPLPVQLAQNRDTLLALSPPVVIPVRSLVPSDAQSIRDLAPLATFPYPWWPWLLGAGFVLLLAASIYYFWKKQQQSPPPAKPTPAEPQVPPYEAAQRRLRKLETTAHLDEATQIKPFYVELADILRTYLKQRAGLAALETTTRELVRDLSRQADQGRLPDETPQRVGHVLGQADFAKFADAKPPADAGREALAETRDVLDAVERHLRAAEQPVNGTVPEKANV